MDLRVDEKVGEVEVGQEDGVVGGKQAIMAILVDDIMMSGTERRRVTLRKGNTSGEWLCLMRRRSCGLHRGSES